MLATLKYLQHPDLIFQISLKNLENMRKFVCRLRTDVALLILDISEGRLYITGTTKGHVHWTPKIKKIHVVS